MLAHKPSPDYIINLVMHLDQLISSGDVAILLGIATKQVKNGRILIGSRKNEGG